MSGLTADTSLVPVPGFGFLQPAAVQEPFQLDTAIVMNSQLFVVPLEISCGWMLNVLEDPETFKFYRH